jgi:hypothetical protein
MVILIISPHWARTGYSTVSTSYLYTRQQHSIRMSIHKWINTHKVLEHGSSTKSWSKFFVTAYTKQTYMHAQKCISSIQCGMRKCSVYLHTAIQRYRGELKPAHIPCSTTARIRMPTSCTSAVALALRSLTNSSQAHRIELFAYQDMQSTRSHHFNLRFCRVFWYDKPLRAHLYTYEHNTYEHYTYEHRRIYSEMCVHERKKR